MWNRKKKKQAIDMHCCSYRTPKARANGRLQKKRRKARGSAMKVEGAEEVQAQTRSLRSERIWEGAKWAEQAIRGRDILMITERLSSS